MRSKKMSKMSQSSDHLIHGKCRTERWHCGADDGYREVARASELPGLCRHTALLNITPYRCLRDGPVLWRLEVTHHDAAAYV